jgi:hypothetical protein
MKDKFQEILSRLFKSSFYRYYSNMDDVYEGFEFNPNDPRTMVRLLFSIQGSHINEFETRLRIEKYSIVNYSHKLIKKTIISGSIILKNDGMIDYEFYETILCNLNNF